ncbi:hypothetical protein [Paenibacillus amylolyticus]|uniref:hypothetical protein n=1 Tax=Paenibacillus amylolyticus TaxID=1451 RepID=UPI0015897EBE|nr:hypothetical protein [Paenibacillus amylolyticus]
MNKQLITYVCHECNEFIGITKSHAKVEYCPYCGKNDLSQYSKEAPEPHLLEGRDNE